MKLTQDKRNRFAVLALFAQAGLALLQQTRVFLILEESYSQIRQGDPLYAKLTLNSLPSAWLVLIQALIFSAAIVLAALAVKRSRPWGRPLGIISALLSMNVLSWPAGICALYFLIPASVTEPIESEISAAFKAEPSHETPSSTIPPKTPTRSGEESI